MTMAPSPNSQLPYGKTDVNVKGSIIAEGDLRFKQINEGAKQCIERFNREMTRYYKDVSDLEQDLKYKELRTNLYAGLLDLGMAGVRMP